MNVVPETIFSLKCWTQKYFYFWQLSFHLEYSACKIVPPHLFWEVQPRYIFTSYQKVHFCLNLNFFDALVHRKEYCWPPTLSQYSEQACCGTQRRSLWLCVEEQTGLGPWICVIHGGKRAIVEANRHNSNFLMKKILNWSNISPCIFSSFINATKLP